MPFDFFRQTFFSKLFGFLTLTNWTLSDETYERVRMTNFRRFGPFSNLRLFLNVFVKFSGRLAERVLVIGKGCLLFPNL